MSGETMRALGNTIRLIALAALLSVLAACGAARGNGTPPALLAVHAAPPQPLTFYEGDENIEPFTPFLALRGPQGSVLALGFAEREGAYYITTYDAVTWQERGISNGFQPSDPQWDCDQAPDISTTFSTDLTRLARTCADGSMTIFALPEAVPLYHQAGASGDVALADRAPAAVFAPDGRTLAVTDDGPSGPGTTITLLDTQTWQARQRISIAAGLLSRPSWSPDGTRLAEVALDGTLHIWNAATGAQVAASAPVPQFAVADAASDPAGPAPLWSPDGATLFVAAPTAYGATISRWTLHGAILTPGATVTVAVPPTTVAPQLAPDGSYLFIHTAPTHGQLLATSDLHAAADFALPGPLAIWSDARHIAAFTLQATVVVLSFG
jgi:WD40 repeat protein